jgi:hypothetical protein
LHKLKKMNTTTTIHAGDNPKVTIGSLAFDAFICTKIIIEQDHALNEIQIFSKNDLKITFLPERKI